MKYHKGLLIAGCYTILTIILTYPVTFYLTSHIAGYTGEDNLQWRWYLWWFRHALLTLQTSPADVSILYAPTGGEQPFYTITAYIPALALPITLLAGPTASFNLSFLLAFALSGYTAYLLAYYLTRQRSAAFIAGAIFAFSPVRFGYATGTFLGQMTAYFLPLYVLALWMLAQRPTWLRVVWAAVVLACLCLTWSLLVAYGVGLFTIVFLLFQLVTWLRRPETRNRIKFFAAMYGLTLVLIVGLYWPMLIQMVQGKQAHIVNAGTTFFAIDALAFISPSNLHPIWQPLHLLPGYATRVLADQNDIQERLAYLGVAPVVLTIVGLIKFRRCLSFWLVVALSAMVLSLGPLLKFNGQLLQLDIEGYVGYVVLPYALLRSIPILEWSGTLGRFNVDTMLCLAVMAAYGLAYLLPKLRSTWQFALTLSLLLLILLDFLTIFPFPLEPDVTPDFYTRLRQEGEIKPQAIIDLPLSGSPAYNNYSMHYQTVHQQAIAGGHFIRRPARVREMIGFINQLLWPPLNQSVLSLPEPQARLGLLNKFGFTKVTARRWLMMDEKAQAQLAYLATWLGDPRLEGDVSVFEIPPGDQSLPITALLAGEGWQPLDNGARLQLQAPADVFIYVDKEQVQPIALQLALAATESDRYLVINVDNRPALRLYLSRETLNYHLPLSLSVGAHQLTFYPDETACQKECAPVNFSRIAFDSFAPVEHLPITFDEQLSLVHYEVSAKAVNPGQPLLVYLYWQGQRPLSVDYSAFVHLVSPTGELVGQADYLLGGWLYSTSQWPAGHITAVPSLFFIPPTAAPGEYQLQSGVYNTQTAARLPVSAGVERRERINLAIITVGEP